MENPCSAPIAGCRARISPRTVLLPLPPRCRCRKAPPEPAQGRDLQLASLHCRQSRKGGRDPPAKNPGDPLEAGGTCPGCSSSKVQQFHSPKEAPRILCPSGGSRRAEGRVKISHGKDGWSWEKGGLRDYGQEPIKAGDQFSPPWGEESGASAPQELVCFLMRSWECCCKQPATRLPSTVGMQCQLGTPG